MVFKEERKIVTFFGGVVAEGIVPVLHERLLMDLSGCPLVKKSKEKIQEKRNEKVVERQKKKGTSFFGRGLTCFDFFEIIESSTL